MEKPSSAIINPQKARSLFELVALAGGVAVGILTTVAVYGGKVGTLIEQNNERDRKITELQGIVWPDHDDVVKTNQYLKDIDEKLTTVKQSVDRLETHAMGGVWPLVR